MFECGASEGRPRRVILVVEDDREVRRLLATGLEAEGFEVVEAADRREALDRLRAGRVDLVTLDIGLGADDGLHLAHEIRRLVNVPIVVVTGRAEPVDRVRGLEHGVDDYVVKPFLVREVVLRVRALLARYAGVREDARAGAPETPETYGMPGAVLDVRRRELRRADGAVVELTGMEVALLGLFLRHPGRVLSRDEINNVLRGRDWSPTDRSLDGHVARLRRKIEPLSDEPRLIKSVRGVGYVFCG